MHRRARHPIEAVVLVRPFILHIVDGLDLASDDDLSDGAVLYVGTQGVSTHLIVEVHAIDMLDGECTPEDVDIVELLASEVEVRGVSRELSLLTPEDGLAVEG